MLSSTQFWLVKSLLLSILKGGLFEVSLVSRYQVVATNMSCIFLSDIADLKQ